VTNDGSCPNINAMHGHDVHVVALDGDKLKPREDQRKGGNGFGINEDGAGYTLTGVDRHGVAYGIGNGQAAEASATIRECSQTLNCMHDKQATVQCYDMTHTDDPGRKVADGVSPTLQSRTGTGGNQVPLAVSTQGLDGYNQQMTGECAPTLRLCKSDADHVPSIISTNSSRDTEPIGIGRDVFNSGANASFSPDIRVGVQPTLTARTTQGAVCARLKGDE
jgi:hypothetical protein